MIKYIVRRLLYSIPILIGVNILTFCLFFIVNSPDDMAAVHLGQKHVSQDPLKQENTLSISSLFTIIIKY